MWRDYLLDAAVPRSTFATFKAIFLNPLRHFHVRAHPLWTLGYGCYHLAIFTVVLTYGACVLALLVRRAEGCSFPVVETAPNAVGLVRCLLLIFGSGETRVAQFLFGRGHFVLSSIGWWELGLATVGNCALTWAWIRHGMGALTRDLDETCRQIRIGGARVASQIAVRALVFSIIQTEWLGRLDLCHYATQLHTVLGLTLLLISPFCYLAHLYLAPFAVLAAWRRHRLRITA